MLAIFIPSEFANEVDATVASMGLPLKLGSKLVELGPHVGSRFVNCAILNPSTGWTGIITACCSGGTARREIASEDGFPPQVRIEVAAGRTVKFTGPTGTVWGPFTIEEVDPASLFVPAPMP